MPVRRELQFPSSSHLHEKKKINKYMKKCVKLVISKIFLRKACCEIF